LQTETTNGEPRIIAKIFVGKKDNEDTHLRVKEEIKSQLDKCGISLATMYPELYKVAEYLKNKKYL
jgi:hypothetical protein